MQLLRTLRAALVPFLLVTLLVPAVRAQDGPVVTYRVDLRQPQTQTLEVTVTVPTAGLDSEEFLLPVWRPGRYTVLNPAGTVRRVRAWSETGAELPVRKSANSAWRVTTNGAEEVSVAYTVYANSLGDRTRHVDPTHAFLSGSSVFLYTQRLRGAPCRVEVDAPAGWDIATGLEHAPGRDDVVVAPDYDVLVDSPLEIGEHDRIEFEVLGKPHEIVIWPAGVEHDAERMVADFSKLVTEQHAIFGELPYERYVFLVHAGAGGGGTEHLNSTIMQTSRGAIEGSVDGDGSYERFLGLVSHEFFHTWNVKQFRPVGIHPYDYQDENVTDLLWVCEGSTSYYSALTQVRAGLDEPEPYVRGLGRAADRLRKDPAARVQSVADASWDSWVASRDPDTANRTVDFYGKGSQVSLCLDLELRRRTDGRVSYDDVMRALYERFPLDGPGYSSDDLLALLQELSGSSFAAFFDAYVFGTDELPFEEVLPTVGLELVFEPNERGAGDAERGGRGARSRADVAATDADEAAVAATAEADVDADARPTAGDSESGAEDEAGPDSPAPLPQKAYLGLRLAPGGSGSVVSGFRPDGPAFASGLVLGDEILTLDERRLRPNDLDERLEDYAPGDVVRLHFLRDDRLRTIELTLGGTPDGNWVVRRVEEPTDAQKAAYRSWCGQPWPGEEDEDAAGDETAPEGVAPPTAGPEAAPVPAPTESSTAAASGATR